MVTKKDLLKNIKNDTYCKIGVSKIHGVGVIAIKEIPKGINPFVSLYSTMEFIIFHDADFDQLDPVIIKYIKSFFVRTKKEYPIMLGGLNSIGVFGYINHSDKPNMELGFGSMTKLCPFLAIRDIKVGEELFWDYRTSGGDDLKNQYPFLK
jgi:SET domain-containing protein